ncbi:MAG: hypothetical protein RQ750_15595 [Roseovarius sp.]|nr:hypothetical protein [Roseovarius sp.]
MRRRATIALHWLNASLLLFVLADGGKTAVLAWVYVSGALSMSLLALVFGLMNGPGPKLEGLFRRLHPWLHRLIYALMAWGAVALGAQGLGRALPGPEARVLLMALLAVTLLHGVFNLWRHTALGDGALRRITPRAIHHIL